MVTLGLIADTHMPRWCKEIPASVFDLFADVDLILHAGDVGELWVLDNLSQIAPVMAVHGNDEPPLTQKALPFLQTIVAAKQRLVLTHGHYADVEAEVKTRSNDNWHPKLHDYAQHGHDYGASYVISGHSHIPLMTQYEGIWLINPGAVSPGNDMIQQKLRSVAKMTLDTNGGFDITYFELENPAKTFMPQVDLEAGFRAARDQVQDSAFEREFEALTPWIGENVLPLARDQVVGIAVNMAKQYRAGKIPRISTQMVMHAIKSNQSIPPVVIERLSQHPAFASYLK